MKKIRIEFSEEQLHELLTLIPKKPSEHQDLRNLIAGTYLRKVSPKLSLDLMAAAADGLSDAAPDAIMAIIVQSLSHLTGYPAASITLGKKLDDDLDMTSFKRDQLREYLNNYLKSQPGAVTLSSGDVTGFKTVQDVYDAMQANTN